MGNAERQARWRERQKAKLAKLEAALNQGETGELRQENAALERLLAAAQARIAELEAQLKAPAAAHQPKATTRTMGRYAMPRKTFTAIIKILHDDRRKDSTAGEIREAHGLFTEWWGKSQGKPATSRKRSRWS